MAPRKGTKKNKGSLVKDKEELELINKVKNQLKEDLDSQEKDIIKLRRACLFLEHYEEISPSSRLADDSEYKQNVKIVDNMLNEWKQDLKIGDTLETYLPEENCWYTGKVIESKENPKQHLIHFLKWDKKFDRWIDPNDYLIQPFGTLIFADEPKASTPAIEKPAVTPQKTSETVEVVEKTKTGRVIKKLVKANTPVSAPVSREKKSDSKSSQKKIQDDNDGDEDHNDWACTVCNMIETMDNDILVLCDGPCLRSFHHGCLDAAVRPDKDKVQEIRWLCNDCLQGSHLCFLCGERGEDYLDLFKCSLKMCGKYYHVNCLLQEGSSFIPPHVTYKEEIIQGDAAKQIIKKYQKRKEDPSQSFEKSRPAAVRKTSNGRGNSRKKKATKQEEESEEQEEMDVVNDDLQVEGEKDNEVKESIIITGDDSVIIRDVPNFHCSAHYCDTCSESYNKSLKVTTSLEACVYCPRAFHMNCIPPGARFNNFCLVCPLHPNRLLPGRARDDLKKVLFNLDIKQENNGDPSSVNEGSNMIDDHNLSIIPVFYDQLHIPEDFPDAGDLEGSHYRLPYYIKEEVENTPLTFKLINKNNYELITAEKMPPLTIPEYGCECKDICNYACLNAMMHIECCEMKSLSREGPLCSVGKHCTNRKLQNREYVKSIIFQEENMGLGLKSVDKVRKGTLIIEYIGEVIDEDEMIRRLNEQNILRPHDKDYYVMQLTNDLYVDGKFQGNFSRFINHSCDPNCELQRWNVRGHTRIAIVAIKDIEAGEPFSYDYQFETQQEEAFKCYCKTSKCRGTMAPNSSERLLKLAKSGRNEELRSKLIELGKIREKEANSYNVLKEKELQRCYTSSLLPGDSSHLMKNGPLKNTFRFARMNKLLLVRNLMKSTSLLKRCQVYLNENESSVTAHSNNAAVSSVKEGNGRQSSRRSERKTVSSTSANTNSDSKSTNTPGRRGRKRKSYTKKDDDDDDEDYIMEVVELDS